MSAQAHAFKHAFFQSLSGPEPAPAAKKTKGGGKEGGKGGGKEGGKGGGKQGGKAAQAALAHSFEERAKYSGGKRLADFDVPAEEVEWQSRSLDAEHGERTSSTREGSTQLYSAVLSPHTHAVLWIHRTTPYSHPDSRVFTTAGSGTSSRPRTRCRRRDSR